MSGSDPLLDAHRRIKYKSEEEDGKLASVDIGSPHIDPHSEASFSPIRPAIIAFLCLDIDEKASKKPKKKRKASKKPKTKIIEKG